MRIRRLELQGFKSFKDKTVINFDDGITGIVGPNGCGKSNVVDAFFWVMGEQNARHLRGQSMEDLIFAGSDKSPAGAYAEVTLVLDMPGDLSGPNAPAGASSKDVAASPVTLPTREVQLTRKLYRSGESDYSINRTPCRLRDIQELFMDTGVGSRGYSIIQQGQIAKIVQAKPEDRRTMIEEVAGIVKYKNRRKESMRKLEGTQQNLLRVTDVINELENQKRQMERQADKARKYKEWNTRLQEIEVRFNALKWEDYNNKVGILEQELDVLTTEDASLTTARETAETQIAQKRMEAAQSSKVAEEFQQKWMTAGTNLNNVENELKYSQKNLEDLRTSSAQLEKDTDEEKILIQNLTAQHEALVHEASTMDEQSAAADLEKQEQETKAATLRATAESAEREAEAAKQRLYSAGSELEKAKSAANFSRIRLQELGESMARIMQDRAEREEFLANAKSEKEIASEALRAAQTALEEARNEAKRLSSEMADKNRALDEQRRSVAKLSSEQARLRATVETLEDQKLRHENASKGVQAVFQDILPANPSLQSAVKGTLADSLQVEQGMESAVEAALGRALDLILTSSADAHLTLAEALQKSEGRAAFADVVKLSSMQVQSKMNFQAPEQLSADVLGPLSKFVTAAGGNAEVEALLHYLLDKTILVKSAATASTLAKDHAQHTFVTPEGEIFRGGWFMEGGDKSSVSGSYVSRNREIKELNDQLEALSTEIAAAQAALQQLETDLAVLTEQRATTEERIRSSQSEMSKKSSAEASLNARLEEAQRSLQKFLQEESRFLSEQERLSQTESEAQARAVELEAEKTELDSSIAVLSESLLQKRLAWEEAQHGLMNARVKAANLADQKNSIHTRTRQSQNSLDQHKNRINSMIEQAERRQGEFAETSERIVVLQEQIGGLRDALVEAEQNYRSAKDQLDIVNNEVEELRTAAQDIGARERQIKESLLQKRLDHQKYTSDRDLLAQNTFERYGLVMAEYAMMPETMEQVQLLRDAGEGTINEIQNEVTLLREKIRKLGDVNPAAVEEYEMIIERYNLLSTQKADLEKAMADLQSTVDRINHVSKERFERAFHEVNGHFQRVFPVIFGGGHAHLTLTNPEDMLETGVDITAQPPGKKAQNINLLSGGEKTLTAISLLFSIFLVKPSPFCLLDEVDAPLDDANIGRFNALLREMSKRSQFIIITHNKRTMELNDKLYGVTMEDAGVSKMVSIQLSASA